MGGVWFVLEDCIGKAFQPRGSIGLQGLRAQAELYSQTMSQLATPTPRPLRTPTHPDPAVDEIAFPRGRRDQLKDLAGVWLARTGLAAAWVRLGRVAGATILTYHSVAESQHQHWIDPRSRIAPGLFEEHLRFLVKRRSVVALDEIVSALEEGRTLPAGTVAVTLDDGYRDLLSVVAPLARKYKVPMTAFVVTGWCDREEAPWLDRLHGILRHRTRDVLWWEDDSASDLRDATGLAQARVRLEGELIGARGPKRDQILQRVTQMLVPSGEAPRVVATWDELRILRDEWPELTLEVHTAEHPDCRTLSGAELSAELGAARERFSEQLGRSPTMLAFPYNRTNEDCADTAKAAGLRACFASGGDPLVVAGQRPQAIPRLDAPQTVALAAWLTSGAHPGLVRALGAPVRALLGRRS